MEVILEAFPPETRQFLRALYGTLPVDVRRELELSMSALFKLVQKNPGAASDLVNLVCRQAGPAVKPLSKVAVVGPVNVGKSTLYNALVGNAAKRAETSPLPGTTREPQIADLGLFWLVDTPGADHGAGVGAEEKEKALKAANAADFLLIVFDAARSVTASDKVLYGELRALGKPHAAALNKIDLVKRPLRPAAVESAAGVLDLDPASVLPISAARGWGVEQLILEIAASEPRLLGRLGETIPTLRRKLGWQAIRRATLGSAVVALTPIPVLDLVPLTALQISMVLTLTRIYGQEASLARAGEVLASCGAGLVGRTLFQQLSKLGGVPGWALSVSVAAATTLAIGYSTMRWYETGRKPTQAEILRTAREFQRRLLSALRPLGRGRPGREKLEEELERGIEAIAEERGPAGGRGPDSGSGSGVPRQGDPPLPRVDIEAPPAQPHQRDAELPGQLHGQVTGGADGGHRLLEQLEAGPAGEQDQPVGGG